MRKKLEELNIMTSRRLLARDSNEWFLLPNKIAEAKRISMNWYFTGNTCLNGHIAPRRSLRGTCLACEGSPKARKERKIRYQEVKAIKSSLSTEDFATPINKDKDRRSTRQSPETKLNDLTKNDPTLSKK